MNVGFKTCVVLVLGLLLCGTNARADQAAEMQKTANTIPIEYLAHLPVIKVLINGQGPHDFIVDTGAGVTVINQDLVAGLGIPVVGTSAIGSPMGTKRIQADSLTIREIQIGDVAIEGQPAVAMELRKMFQPLEAPAGILAAASFEGLLLTIDFPNDVVILRKGALPAADGEVVLDYDASSIVPRTLVSVAELELLAALDTGAPSSIVVPSEYIDKLPLLSEPVVTGHGKTVDATFDIMSADLDGALHIGRISIEKPSVTFADRSTVCHIGSQILRQYALTIDRSNRRVMFEEKAANAGDPVRKVVQGGDKKRYGIRLSGLAGDALDVIGVDEGLAAADGGLKGGDKIIAMNGQPVKSLSTDERISCLRGSPLVLTVERGTQTIEITLSLD